MSDSSTDPRAPRAKPSAFQVWRLAARPGTLWAGACPVALGVALALADGAFHAPAAVLTLVAALLLQIGTNYCNDYCDHRKGADTSERQGPTRATQAGWVAPSAMRNATVLVFALAAVSGLYLIGRGGWPIALIAAASILSGVLYTAGPRPIGYIGLGDVFVLVFFGPVAVAGTYYLQTLEMKTSVFWLGLAPGLWSVALLTVNNLRDADQDRGAGKRTLAARFGRGFARAEFTFCALGAPLVPLLVAWSAGSHRRMLPTLLLLPLSAPALRAVWTGSDGATLNPVLGSVSRLLSIHTALLSVLWNL